MSRRRSLEKKEMNLKIKCLTRNKGTNAMSIQWHLYEIDHKSWN